jgi:MFS family permease|tara:strand:+ start:6297 stop:7529 length:1233 start_codon:yes stop_codon:yes gene_type:complete
MIINIVKSNFKIIIFGFVFTFFSCIGQSFFIGLFNSSIREELNITHGQFGSIYAVSTLCSSIALIWLGKIIDDLKLVNYSIIVVFFLFVAALFFSFVNGIILLTIGIFFLRLSGQGLMAHTASTAISRYFEKSRGKALSYIWFGMSLGEFLLPIIIVYLLSFLYWRDLWIQISILTLVFLPLFSYFSAKDIKISSREIEYVNSKNNFQSVKSWTRKEVLKDFRFYTILPALLAPPFIITGMVINQSFIIESKNWGLYSIAKAFMFYSLITVVTLLLSGFLIDKLSSRKLLPFLNVPLLLSLIVLIFFDHEYIAFIFMGLLGMTNGLINIFMSSLWAEIYGVNYLGSIKALTASLMVFSTAFATAVFGILIDFGHSIENIAILCAFYSAISILILIIYKKSYKPTILKNKT